MKKQFDFKESRNSFRKWINENYKPEEYTLLLGDVSLISNVKIEKWIINSETYLVEIYHDGNGFNIYKPCK
jgi:hypothetical protein